MIEDEIVPVIGEASKPDGFKQVIKKCGIIIECATCTPSSEIMDNLMKEVVGSGKDEHGNKKLYIQTTGFMQYAFEDHVLKNENITGCIVRPAFVYGGSGGIVFRDCLFKHDKTKKFKIGADPKNVWPWVHICDLAEGYMLILDHKDKIQGQIFRIGELDPSITYEKLRIACGKAMGVNVTDIEYGNPEGLEMFLKETHVTSFENEATKEILKWKPKFPCVLTNLDVAYKSFVAWQSHQ